MMFKKSRALVFTCAVLGFGSIGAAEELGWVSASMENETPPPAPANEVATCQSEAQPSTHNVSVTAGHHHGYRVVIDHVNSDPEQPQNRTERMGVGRRISDTFKIRFVKDGAPEKGSLSLERTGKETAKGTLVLDDEVTVPLTCTLVADRIFPHRFDGFHLTNCSRHDTHVTKIDIRDGSRSSSINIENGIDIAAGDKASFDVAIEGTAAIHVWSDRGRRACFRFIPFDKPTPE